MAPNRIRRRTAAQRIKATVASLPEWKIASAHLLLLILSLPLCVFSFGGNFQRHRLTRQSSRTISASPFVFFPSFVASEDANENAESLDWLNTSATKGSTTPRDLNLTALTLVEVDVLYDRRSSLTYDATLDRYVRTASRNNNIDDGDLLQARRKRNPLDYALKRLKLAFIPSGVTPNYFPFMRWRILQRLINANLHVFGTQSLLMGLGIKSTRSQLGALSTATKWVLKDALGKLVRMVWASRMGRRFDSDAKRWRLRSSFVFAVGNALEIVTYLLPNLFLLWATLANCCKQVSMLTSSATRTAIYNSFRKPGVENISELTAKGESQICLVDLLGIASGVTFSKSVMSSSVWSVLLVYLTLQASEIFCMYRQLRCVTYRVLNFERLTEVIERFAQEQLDKGNNDKSINGIRSASSCVPTPKQMAATERILLPPLHLARRSSSFGSLGRARLTPSELSELRHIFAKERFLLIVGPNVKHQRRQNSSNKKLRVEEDCHIVLHEAATNLDIVKSTLALTLLRRKLAASPNISESSSILSSEPSSSAVLRSGNCMPLIQEALQECDKLFALLLRELTKAGWESPARFMFGRVHMRAYWPLTSTKKQQAESQ